MRSIGGAGVGLLAWLVLGCFPMPPPDPGRPPPPPEMLPAPPPEPATSPPARSASTVTTAGQGKTTKAAEAPATELALEWDAGTRTLRCGDRVALAVPADLTVYVRKDGGDDVTIVPPGSPPDAALVVTDLGTMSISGDDDPTLQMATAAFGERLDRIANALMTVRGIANGKEPGEPHVYVHNSANGIADATYVLDEAPDILWRLLLFQAGPCLFASVEQVHLDAAQRFAPMLQRMCTASRSSSQTRCQPRPSLTIPVH